ncbi:MAG: hypothetical protein K2F59_03690 [Eubacteriales bacterium]|nr:hypothetical protein [Eubacteriales bacterium]
MLTAEEKEILRYICKNSNNDVFKSYDTEYIKENFYLISELEDKGFIKKSCDDLYEVLIVVILPKSHYAIKNNFKDFEVYQNANITGNNNVINYGNISNSFTTDSLNQSIKELKDSDEPEELKQIILNAYQEHNELLQQTITDIKNATTKQSKLDIVKSFIKNIKSTVQDVKSFLNIILNYF